MTPLKSSATPPKVAYTIIERGGRSIWHKVGVAFVNRDDSLNVKLDSLPVNGTLHIRDADPKDGEPAEATSLRPVPHVIG